MVIFTVMNASYYTIGQPGQSVFRDKGSRFLGFVYPVNSVEEVHTVLDQFRKTHHDARHHCYAYRLGPTGERWRVNDDGEPSGSAGKPIYGQLLSHNITFVLALVIRYFGGVKLGVPGLIHAYRSATLEALQDTIIIEKLNLKGLTIQYEYAQMNKVMKLLKEEEAEILTTDFGLHCIVKCTIPYASVSRIGEALDPHMELIWDDISDL
jgi:uncharacterized YigZ family protein